VCSTGKFAQARQLSSAVHFRKSPAADRAMVFGHRSNRLDGPMFDFFSIDSYHLGLPYFEFG
jgi:hypothetical protein